MTVEEGISKCESSPKCAAFTYHGPKGDLTNKYNLYFFTIHRIRSKIPNDIDWTTYVVSGKKFVQLENASFPSHAVIWPLKGATEQVFKQHLGKVCLKVPQCIGYSVSSREAKLLLEKVDFDARIFDTHWDTYLLISKSRNVSFTKALSESNPQVSCCNPSNLTEPDTSFEIVNPIPRAKCNLTKEEFEARFIHTKTPVILENCTGYENWKHSKFSLEPLLTMYYDNTTKPGSTKTTSKLSLADSFTHTKTPNDEQFDVDLALEKFASGRLRSFELLRNNAKTDVFAQFPKPSVFPDDLYHATEYETHYNWAILSQANTGSLLHVDPDCTGAWNYLIHGHKHWVIFPPGNFTNQFTI